MARPVTIVSDGRAPPFVQVNDGPPATPVASGGVPIALVASGAPPICLVNDDGSPWSGSLPANALYADDGVTALYADDGTTVLTSD